MNSKIEELAKPFPAEDIEWRVGSTNKDKTKGIALAYLTARAVMNRLDEVLSPENWQDSYSVIPGTAGDTKGYICSISIHLGDTWVSKQDGADESNMESIKGGISDAFKRTAVKWGVGRYLYDVPNEWVPIESYGNSYKLSKIPNLPAWALPEGTKQPARAAAVGTPTPKVVEKPKPSVQNEKPAVQNVYEDYVYPATNQAVASADHNIFIDMIREAIVSKIDQRNGRTVTEKANKFAHILLQQAIPDQDQRHNFCTEVFKVDSWSAIPGEEVGGFLDWLSPEKVDSPDGKFTYRIPGEVTMLIGKAISR